MEYEPELVGLSFEVFDMARMIPEGPNLTASYHAEPAVYLALARLDDSFTVIHSLPWLRAAVKSLDRRYAPTGEIDFIVLHPALGILAIEVKGGVFRYDRTKFVYLRSNRIFDPVGQLRRGTFALTDWVRQAGIAAPTVGYAWIFPDVDIRGKPLPPAMVDPACPGGGPVVDMRGMLELDRHIVEIMGYWQQTLRPVRLTPTQIDQIVDLICPVAEYDPGWDARIEVDTKTWLTFTADQGRILKNLLRKERTVVAGRSGTGKTVLALALARYLAQDGRRVLFLLFNSPIARKIRTELNDTPGVYVQTFHGLCSRASTTLGHSGSREDEAWFERAHLDLDKAVRQGKMGHYDALIVDEGQIFLPGWWSILGDWIRRAHVFCDDTQVFPLEFHLSYEQIIDILGGDEVGVEILTVNMRSPWAVFDRIRAALPTPYQQFSPREDQPDTLTEVAVLDPELELQRVLRQLNQAGVPPDAIAVIHHQPVRWEFPEEVKTLAGTVDTSPRLRGMEFPMVIAYNMGFSGGRMYPINAYARATTRVIAIYSLWDLRLFEIPEWEQDPFISALLENPELARAVNDPWAYLTDHLGWELVPVSTEKIALFWSPTMGAWVCQSAGDRLSEEIWINHILFQTPYPVVICKTDRGFVGIRSYELPRPGLTGKQEQTIWKIGACPECEQLCVREQESGRPNCLRCQPGKSISFPSDLARRLAHDEQILQHPDRYNRSEKLSLGPHLFALGVLRTLPADQFAMLEQYVIRKVRHRNGYQAFLALTGFDTMKATPGQLITLAALEQRYTNWFGRQYASALSQILPTCFSHWRIKGWLEELEPVGTYRRVENLLPLNVAEHAN